MNPVEQQRIGFPPAKLNLGLKVLGKRADGYHDLASIFLPLSGEKGWTDILTLDVLAQRTPRGPHLTTTGIAVPGALDENLVLRAWALLDAHSGGQLPDVNFRLHKTIPTGAGMGGGSADGTFALRMLNDALSMALEENELSDLAAALGSDCPFFIQDDPAHITGRGECLEAMGEVWDALRGWHVAVVHPGIHISTRAAFAGIQVSERPVDLREVVQHPVHTWEKHGMTNDFQTGIAATHPAIASALSWMQEAGAAFHALTGTGSAVFGLFDTPASADNIRHRAVSEGWMGFSGPVGG